MKTDFQKRDPVIEMMKGMGILFVVMLHVGLPSGFWTGFLGSFHMVLFIFCSGYCFKDTSLERGFIPYFKKKVFSIYVPYVVFNGIIVLLHNFLIHINVYTNNEEFVNASIGIANYYGLQNTITAKGTVHWLIQVLKFSGETQLGGATWFLRSLFVISIVFFAIHYLVYKLDKAFFQKNIVWVQTVCALVFLFLGCYGHTHGWANHYQLLTSCSIYFMFVFGWMVKTYQLFDPMKNVLFSVLGLFLSFMVLKLVSPDANIGINANNYASLEHLVLCSVFGVVFCYTAAELLNRIRYVKNVFVILGHYSLQIMLLHFLAFKAVTFAEIAVYQLPACYLAAFPVLFTNGTWRLYYIIAGCAIPILMSMMYAGACKLIRNRKPAS